MIHWSRATAVLSMKINCSHAPIDDVKGTLEVKGEAKSSGDGSPEQDIKLLPQSEQRVSAMLADVCSTAPADRGSP